MKKLALVLLVAFQGVIAHAQIAKDTIYQAVYQSGVVELKDSIFNAGTDSLLVTWSIPTSNMSLQSGLTNVQVCDACNCYPTNLLPNSHNCKKYLPNSWGIFKMDVTVSANPGVGTSYVTANTNLGPITFAVITWPTNVRQIDQEVNISVYPNPTSGNVKVSFSGKTVSTVNVLNIVGKKVAKYEVGKNTVSPFSFSMDNLSEGVYLLQFTDASGKVLGVKRITKQ
jgi:hypothetical protein